MFSCVGREACSVSFPFFSFASTRLNVEYIQEFICMHWILFKEYFKNGRLGTFFADQALYFGVTVVLAVACLEACEGVGAVWPYGADVAGSAGVGDGLMGAMSQAVLAWMVARLV